MTNTSSTSVWRTIQADADSPGSALAPIWPQAMLATTLRDSWKEDNGKKGITTIRLLMFVPSVILKLLVKIPCSSSCLLFINGITQHRSLISCAVSCQLVVLFLDNTEFLGLIFVFRPINT